MAGRSLMPAKKPTTIEQYIAAAPAAGQPHLRKLHALLKAVAPRAQEAIKWNTPFFIEPRFLFSFSAHKQHLDFAPSAELLLRFAGEFGDYDSTKHMFKVRYEQPFPEALIRKMARARLKEVSARKDDSFW
jgi:uncharacterized protein YdhG (YjbR/CyaY superfamily)